MTEIRRLGVRLGANPRTFTGLAGYGDLILTCTGDLSRNHTVGKKIGQGVRLSDILAQTRSVAERVRTAKSVYDLSRQLGVEMPICEAVYAVVNRGAEIGATIEALLARPLRSELDQD